jgi:hypothetical protein
MRFTTCLLSLFLILFVCSSCSNSFKLVANAHSKQQENSINKNLIVVESFDEIVNYHQKEKIDPLQILELSSSPSTIKSDKKEFFSSRFLKIGPKNKLQNKLLSSKWVAPIISKKENHEGNRSENFWGDMIKDFFITLLIGIIIIFLVVTIIEYGSPLLIQWILIILACLAALFIVILLITWIVLKILGEI